MASLEGAIDQVAAAAEKLKGSGAAGNEANTRALLIDPLLTALGWNLYEIDEVEREYRVFDGTFLDYALRIDGKPRLFIEAKALNKSLADKPFIAQTVNYANNEGVLWCVLTNGLRYQVYKSNEPVPMERKLLFEVDLLEGTTEEGRGGVLRSLRTLGKEAVGAGELDRWGESVFTDVRVRAALAVLAKDPSTEFLSVVSAAIEGPVMTPEQLRHGLGRVLGSSARSATSSPLVGTAAKSTKPDTPPQKGSHTTTYGVESHTGKRPVAIGELFEQINALALALGADVNRRVTKMYIGYFAGKKSFCTVELQKTKILVYISMPANEAKPWDEAVMRDVSNIGHYGMGDTEFTVSGADQLGQTRALCCAPRTCVIANRAARRPRHHQGSKLPTAVQVPQGQVACPSAATVPDGA